MLFFQHDARWQKNISGDYQITVFNNRVNESYSTCNIFDLDFDTSTWSYPKESNRWGPETFAETIYHPDTFSLNSESVSSFQILPNSNRLILSGRFGYVFELTPQSELVWEYLIPFKAGRIVSQGDTLARSDNFTFRYERYPAGFPGFAGRDLSPKGYLELNPNEDFCLELTPTSDLVGTEVNVYPNPFVDRIYVDLRGKADVQILIFDILGRLVMQTGLEYSPLIDLQHLQPGIYFLASDDGQLPLYKVIKE